MIALGREALFQSRPHVRVRPWEFEVIQNRPHVKPGPTDEDGRGSARFDVDDCGAGIDLVLGDRGFLGDVEDIEHVVRNSAALCHRSFRCTDVHPSIQLGCVGVDDFRGLAAGNKRLGHVQGNSRLSGSRRADDGEDHD